MSKRTEEALLVAFQSGLGFFFGFIVGAVVASGVV